MAGTRVVLTLRPDIAEQVKLEADQVGVPTATYIAVLLGQHLRTSAALTGSLGQTVQELIAADLEHDANGA